MGIITVGILGVFSLVAQNYQAQKINKNTLIASMLAQEGIELVRNVRDTNWTTGVVDWDDDIKGNSNDDFIIDGVGGVGIDGDVDDTNTSGNIIEEANAKLYRDSSTNFYTHTASGNTATGFYRLITVFGNDASDPVDGIVDYYKVTSRVQWQEGNGLKDYVAVTYLYNWR